MLHPGSLWRTGFASGSKGTTLVVPFAFGCGIFACCRLRRALGGLFSVILKNAQRTDPCPLARVIENMTELFVARSLVLLMSAACCLPTLAQDRIYRCGNEYTNDAEVAKSRGCKPMDGGNITIIQGPSPRDTAARAPASPRVTSSTPSARSSSERVDSNEQRARDSDARAILEAELRKAQERLDQASKAYANGAPEKEGIESRNHQRYLDRVAELKASVTRAEADVASIQRELARLSGGRKAAVSAAQ